MRIKSIVMVIVLSSYSLMYSAAQSADQSVITDIPAKESINFLALNSVFEDFFKANDFLKNIFDDRFLKDKEFAQRIRDLKSEDFLSEDSFLYTSFMGEESQVFYLGISDEQRKGLFKLVSNIFDRYIMQGKHFFELLSGGSKVLKHPLSWCSCSIGPVEKRFSMIVNIALEAYFKVKKDTTIVYASLASGDLLQDYLQITTLMDLGFKRFSLHLFDTSYPDKRELTEVEKERNKRLIGICDSEIIVKKERLAARFRLFEFLLKESLINHGFDDLKSSVASTYWPQEFTCDEDPRTGKERIVPVPKSTSTQRFLADRTQRNVEFTILVLTDPGPDKLQQENARKDFIELQKKHGEKQGIFYILINNLERVK